VSRALATLRGEQVTDPDVVSTLLPVADVLGPAWLSYLNPAGPPRLHPTEHAQRLVADHDDLLQLQRAVSADDLEESGLQQITSDAFVVREDGVVTSAAGYRCWPLQVAHLGVLTAASARGRGLAAVAAGAAVADAVSHGLLPQWRARPAASRRVAAQLGFQQLGRQLSIRLQEPVP
jgi:RimJ/RimL family protein N-acetyltransferase